MPRVTCARARNPHPSPGFQAFLDEQQPASPETRAFWDTLSFKQRQQLLQVAKKALFQKIRAQYCSRCYGLFALRYEELSNGSTGDCPACQEYYAGLTVTDSGSLSLDPSVLRSQPFTTFSEAKARERERELQFMTGDICGSGWQKSKGQTVCTLHTSPVPVEALLDYWTNLPDEHRTTLFSMREEDFVAELDAHLKYHLKICRDCRSNVVRAYKDLKPLAKEKIPAEEQLELCPAHVLSVADGCVSVQGAGSAEFFERAEEVEDFQVTDGELGDEMDDGDKVRHAETPELAREALVDSVVLIFKSQVEVAFREQTAGHNALLLFVHLVLQMMEEQLQNSSRELAAKQAEAELLELVAEDKKKADKRSKKKKKPAKANKAEASGSCTSCAALQRPDTPPPSSPHHSPYTSPRASPVRHSSPPKSRLSRAVSPHAVPHPVQAPRHLAQSPTLRTADPAATAGWEVQARGRKPTRKALAEPASSASQLSAMEQVSSVGSSDNLSRPPSPPRPPNSAAPRLSKLASGELPVRTVKPAPEASQMHHAPAPVAGTPDILHVHLVRPPPPPPRPAWGTKPHAASVAATPAIPVPAAVSYQPQYAGQHSSPQPGSSSQPLSSLYRLWGGKTGEPGAEESIWQRSSDMMVRQCKPLPAIRPNAWAIPLSAGTQQTGSCTGWKPTVQEPFDAPSIGRSTSFSLFSHSGSVSSATSLEAHFLQGSSPNDAGNYQLFGAGHGLQSPAPLLWGLSTMHPMGVHV